MEIVPLGDSALVVRVGDSLGEVLGAVHRLQAAGLPGVSEIVPAFASVGIFFETPELVAAGTEAVREALQQKRRLAPAKGRTVEVPVCYAGDFAPDLERVAQQAGLAPNEVIQLHARTRYQVRCVGFTPGFPFLSGLPARLATPRRDSPRPSVPAGSVAIGGAQTGIYPLSSPGGWNLIGRTPLPLFDLRRNPPALLQAGDRVHFVTIDRKEFERWEA